METITEIDREENTPGTLAWLYKTLDYSEFVILRRLTGNPAMFWKIENKVEGIQQYLFICEKLYPDTRKSRYNISKDGYIYISPVETKRKDGLFNYSLTPACKKEVKTIITKAKYAFAKWFENEYNK